MHTKFFPLRLRHVSRVLPLACVFVLGGPQAQTSTGPAAGPEPAAAAAMSSLRLVIGAQHEMVLPEGVERMAIGDEAIASVHLKRVGKQGPAARVLLTPLKPGATTLMLWPRGQSRAQTYWLEVEQHVQLRQNLAAGLVEQQYASELAKAQASEQAKAVDLSRVQFKSNVVQVDVKVVEFSKTQLKQVGLNIVSTAPNSHGFSFGVLSSGAYRSATMGPNGQLGVESASPLSQAFNLLMNFGKANIGLNLGVLEANGLARVLAAPTLVALSGQSANFLAGGEVPVPVPQGQGTVGIEYKPYGIGLTVSPTVLADNRIVLKVAPEASELDYSNAVTLQSVSVPAITTRRADTTVELADGESFVIGGLVSRTTTSTMDKVPLLGDLPILGTMFKRQEFSRRERELVIVVTPRLVRPLARDVDIEPLLPGRSEQRQPQVWGPWLTGGLISDSVPGFSQ